VTENSVTSKLQWVATCNSFNGVQTFRYLNATDALSVLI